MQNRPLRASSATSRWWRLTAAKVSRVFEVCLIHVKECANHNASAGCPQHPLIDIKGCATGTRSTSSAAAVYTNSLKTAKPAADSTDKSCASQQSGHCEGPGLFRSHQPCDWLRQAQSHRNIVDRATQAPPYATRNRSRQAKRAAGAKLRA
jgi:hypothetical protein